MNSELFTVVSDLGIEDLIIFNEAETGGAGRNPSRKMAPQEMDIAYAESSIRVLHQQNNFFLPQLSGLINDGKVINLSPEYQRRIRWSKKDKSRLIESLLLNVPIPPVFFYEHDDARYEVMDGQQRLNAINTFLNNDFSLAGLDELYFLNGLSHKDLPDKVSRGLARSSLSATVLLKESRQEEADPRKIRRFVFERLNTGGKRLNAQEIRNSTYLGPMNDLIVELSRGETFCTVFSIPPYPDSDDHDYENQKRRDHPMYKSMKDCEVVLRCLALTRKSKIKGSLKKILDTFMADTLKIQARDLAIYKASFERSLKFWTDLMGDEAFRLPTPEKVKGPLSIAMFDACVAAGIIKKVGPAHTRDDLASLRENVRRVVADEANYDLLVGRKNTAEAVRQRIGLFEAALT